MPNSSSGDEELHNGTVDGESHLGSTTENLGDTKQDVKPEEASAPEPKQDDKKPLSIADAVRAALDKGKEQTSGSGEGDGEGTEETADPKAAKAEGEEEELGELTDEELSKYKPKTRRRFEKLRDENKDLAARLKQEEPEAQGFRAIQEFARVSNLNGQEMQSGFEIMRLMKNDPVKAYEALTPLYNQLRTMVGEVLPADLQTQVDAGQITLPAAKELSHLRAVRGTSANVQAQQAEWQRARDAEEQQQSTQRLQADVGSAITKWETQWKATDPDFSLKQSRVNEAIELELTRAAILAREGKPNRLPRTVEEAVNLANEVKKRVEKEMRAYLPKKNTAITPVTGTGVTNGSVAKPNSVQEAVRMAVGRK